MEGKEIWLFISWLAFTYKKNREKKKMSNDENWKWRLLKASSLNAAPLSACTHLLGDKKLYHLFKGNNRHGKKTANSPQLILLLGSAVNHKARSHIPIHVLVSYFVEAGFAFKHIP